MNNPLTLSMVASTHRSRWMVPIGGKTMLTMAKLVLIRWFDSTHRCKYGKI